MPESSRRRVLRAVGAALPVALAGCNADSGGDATTQQPTDRTATSTASGPSVSASLTRYEYAVRGWRIDGRALPAGDAVPLSDLGADARSAVQTAVDTGAFETDEPTDALLGDVEGVDLVVGEDGAYYSLSHTFTEYVLDLAEDEPTGDASVVDYDAVRDEDAIRDALRDPLPLGPELPIRPHRTLVLAPEVEQFVDEYTHVTHGDRTFRIDFHVERHYPPFTLSAEPADEEAVYGRQLVDVDEFTPSSRAFLREVLDPAPDVPGRGWGHGELFADSVPREVDREFGDSAYARFEDTPSDTVLGFDVHHVEWDRPPLDLSVSATDGPGVEFAVSNTSSGNVRLRSAGVAPFGVLWALPEDGDPVQLWSPDYEDAPEIEVVDGVAEPRDTTEFRLHPEQTVTRTYRLRDENGETPSDTFEVRGGLYGAWNRIENESPGDVSVRYPFGVTLTVDGE